MFKDDYIMKIVNQAAKIMAQILAGSGEISPEVKLEKIDEGLREYVGLSSAELDFMTSDTINMQLGQSPEGIGKMLLVSDLLFAEGKIKDEMGEDSAAYKHWIKSLELRLKLVNADDLSHAHLDSMVDELVYFLSGWQTPTHVVESLFSYYEKTGQFDKAEDTLHDLLNDHITDEPMIDQGLAFYERLLRKGDVELDAGNLPREEVQAGLDELWEKDAG